MTNPRGSAANSAAMSAALSGAVDLSGLKARADAAQKPPSRPAAGGQPPASGGAVLEVDEAGFQPDVVERSMQQLVVVSLWADWSGPSKELNTTLERMAAASGGAWALAKVDVDANPRIAQVFGVQSIPTVIAVGGGQPVDAFSGPLPEAEVGKWLNALLDALRDKLPGIQNAGQAGAEQEEPPEDPRFTEAETAFDNGDFAAADAAYQRILDVEPGNEQAKAAQVQVRFAARSAEADPDAVAKADAAPDDLDAQLAAADLEVSGPRIEDGFTRLIEAVRRTSGEDRNRVREHLVGLFELFDPADPRVAKARRDLASALF